MENKRNFFRVDIYGMAVVVLITRDGVRESYEASLRDVSGSGISFYLSSSIKLEEGETPWVDFVLKGDSFQSETEVVRKQENNTKSLYACEFLNLSERESAKISAILLKLDAVRRK